MIFGQRQVVDIEADIGNGKGYADTRSGTRRQPPGQRSLAQRLLPGHHLTHQPADLHHVAGNAKPQLRITDVHLNLKGDRQGRRAVTALIIAKTHFSDQRLDRKGKTQAAATVGLPAPLAYPPRR